MEERMGFLDILQKNREVEEEKLASMTSEQRDAYMKEKSKAGLDIAKKLGLKVGD